MLNYRELELISNHGAGELERKLTKTKTMLVRFLASEKCFHDHFVDEKGSYNFIHDPLPEEFILQDRSFFSAPKELG